MTSIEISHQITETMLKTIGNRKDHMIAQRAMLDNDEWVIVLNGIVNALDKVLDNLLDDRLLLTSDYNKLDDAMDVLADLGY